MKIKLVPQKEEAGCLIACIAMILSLDYDDVREDFLNDFAKKGIKAERAIEYIANTGRQIVHKETTFFNVKTFSNEQMLKPFAPIHMLRVQQCFDSVDTHAVVMDKDGKLICPQNIADEIMRKSYLITDSWGIFQ